MLLKKTLGIAILLFSTRAIALDVATRQIRIETKFVEAGPGVISADFGLNFGHVYANFPSDLAPGDRISGSIAAVPAGKTDAERAANLAALRDLQIGIGDSRTPVSAGLFVYPRVTPDRISVQLLVDIKPLGSLFVEPKVATPEGRPAFILPVAGVTRGRSRILGPFGGDFSHTRLRIGDTAAHIVAESPRSCIFDVPEAPIGLVGIDVRDGGASASGPFRVIGLRLTPPKPIIHTGDTTSFGAEAYGLSGLERPLTMTLRNLSTDIVAMDGGNEQTLSIAPSEVSAAGTYAIARRLTGIHRGEYAVNVAIPWDEPGTAAR
jgi:hypothetical protein